jgi:hypothetical protein
LIQFEKSVTQCGGMTMLAGGEVAPERGKKGDDASWADVNFIGPKNKENPHDRFSYFKWTVKI